MLIVRPSASGSRVVTRLWVPSRRRIVCQSRVSFALEAFADPAQEVVGENANKNVPVDAVFELVEIRSQSERAFEFAEAGLALEEGHVELPELRGSEALVGLQNRVSALGEGVFHFLLVAGDLESPGAVLERVESQTS